MSNYLYTNFSKVKNKNKNKIIIIIILSVCSDMTLSEKDLSKCYLAIKS